MTGLLRIISVTGGAGQKVLLSADHFFRSVYRFSGLSFKILTRIPLFVKNVDLTVAQAYALGIESLSLVSVIAIFVGAETVIQAVYQMAGIIPMRYLGVLVSKGITIELAPVITSMVVAGRVATGISAEIGSMKTTEQLDAMNVLRLDSIRYLMVPRTIACIVMLPVLVIWAEFLAFMSSIVTVALSVNVSMHSFLNGLQLFFNSGDLYIGVLKTAVFGAIIAITGAHFGVEARAGAEGVGEATTKAVVTSVVLILVFDFLIAMLVL